MDFPNDKTCIERVPWQAPEPGSPSFTKPCWRLIVWRKEGDHHKIERVDHAESVAKLLPLAGWRVTWFATVVNEALKTLGRTNVDATQRTARDGAKWRLRVYEGQILAQDLNTDMIKQYSPDTNEWVEV